jgi:sensor c-di-GMP phosphodiesterase-like protein
MVRAKATRRGHIAFLETELGQKAVVPWDELCNIAKMLRLRIEVEGVELKCDDVKTHIRPESRT